jgi:hypothetical protein
MQMLNALDNATNQGTIMNFQAMSLKAQMQSYTKTT